MRVGRHAKAGLQLGEDTCARNTGPRGLLACSAGVRKSNLVMPLQALCSQCCCRHAGLQVQLREVAFALRWSVSNFTFEMPPLAYLD